MNVARRFRGIVAVGLFPIIVSTATAKYSGGTGEPNDPYQIATVADLIALGETPDDYAKHFILTADIDLDPNLPGRKVFDKAVIAPDVNRTNEWWRIDEDPFTGVFDGNGHVISHLVIKGEDCLGVFGHLAFEAEVRNLGVIHATIVSSGDCVGGLVGYNSGLLTQCYTTVALSGNSAVGGLAGWNVGDVGVRRCYSTGVVKGGCAVGGLVGGNGGHVTQSHSNSTVTGTGWQIGGLVGSNEATLTQSSSAGTVSSSGVYVSVGGLVGDNGASAEICDCYSTSTVSGSGKGDVCVGGLVGINAGYVTCCYSTGQVSGGGSKGGLVAGEDGGAVNASFWDSQTSGQGASRGGTAKTTAEMQTASTFCEAGWDFVGETANGKQDIWRINEGQDYPRLWWEKYGGGTGEPNDPYQIATAADLIALGQRPEDYGKHFILTADIDLDPNLPGRRVFDKAVIAPDTDSAKRGFQGPPFTGIFDGNGHTILHLTVQGKDCLGLFGQLGGSPVSIGTVKDLGVADVNITSSGYGAGGLVGWNTGTVTQSSSTGVVNGNLTIGGLVGGNEGAVIHCYSDSVVRGGDNAGGLVGYNNGGRMAVSYSTGPVDGNDWVGGLVGNNWGDVNDCYSTGAVNGSDNIGGLIGANDLDFGITGDPIMGRVSRCYSTGIVTGDTGVGGLIGRNCWSYGPGGVELCCAEVAGCFWDTQTSGQAMSAGGTGKTTVEMQTASIFLDAGWDFVNETANGTEDVWTIHEGKEYPRLARSVFYPDYVTLAGYGTRTFQWTYGREGEWISEVAGAMTVDYGDGSRLAGVEITNASFSQGTFLAGILPTH